MITMESRAMEMPLIERRAYFERSKKRVSCSSLIDNLNRKRLNFNQNPKLGDVHTHVPCPQLHRKTSSVSNLTLTLHPPTQTLITPNTNPQQQKNHQHV